MANKNKKEDIMQDTNFEIDTDTVDETPLNVVPQHIPEALYKEEETPIQSKQGYVNCLIDKKIIVRHVPKIGGMITNPNHILYGGLAEEATRYLTVPLIKGSLNYVKVLTDSERIFLEHVMGLKDNALGTYNRTENFWENYEVPLQKQDTVLNLQFPEDFIKYKILLKNGSIVAKNLDALENNTKATYQFVLIAPEEELTKAKHSMDATMGCYKILTKISDNFAMLKAILEIAEGRKISTESKIEFLQTRANALIQKDASLFLKIAQDPKILTKILISTCVDKKLINKRNSMYYLASDNSALSETNQQPTLNMAATYINLPKNQELKLSLETLLNKK